MRAPLRGDLMAHTACSAWLRGIDGDLSEGWTDEALLAFSVRLSSRSVRCYTRVVRTKRAVREIHLQNLKFIQNCKHCGSELFLHVVVALAALRDDEPLQDRIVSTVRHAMSNSNTHVV